MKLKDKLKQLYLKYRLEWTVFRLRMRLKRQVYVFPFYSKIEIYEGKTEPIRIYVGENENENSG